MNRFSKFYPLLVLMVFSAAFISCNREKKDTEDQTQVENNEAQISQEKEFIEVDVSAFFSLGQGDTLEITNIRRNRTYTLIIRRVQETMPGLLSIAANIDDRDTGLATLVLQDNKLSGSLELYKEKLRYQVAYDSASSKHYLTEINPEDLDILEGGAPLEAPNDFNPPEN